MFALLIFTLYIIALIVTNKIDIQLPTITWGRTLEDYVSSKNPKSVADVEHSIYEFLRKGNRSFQ